ncbi:hypothetical protein IU443_22280 [Nocardia farcinica]|uniref:Low molecular weight antigen MTB12-like C-terminal domain-containing protein n=1 Tax=Nocardia farcinica TaxID=37329 RepID=A0A0H5NQS8_NOCFR|nr:hypothetical protein [Nocardia farcinica]AXK85982.1 hypothetical protein DXT66_10455 [Nocardia farcinica]MBF6068340.1 hypothetical protein [Nocardia farcinica]MBF6257594.1 hypothetical protein [Nocardia farcinica]MBF6263535.1 hypothetical protein [Nocardia farcinica]MBF6267929.1 hypothetical protein [Nocardia farcinica]
MTRVRTPACLLAAVAAAVLLSGCGGAEPTSAAPPGTAARSSTAATATDQPPVPLPTPADLNTGFQLALDPATPASLKAGAVQGADADPALVDKMAQAAQANAVTMNIVAVEYLGNATLQATADMTLNGKPLDSPTLIPFVAEGGRWKLQLAWACQMLANAQATSPACGT